MLTYSYFTPMSYLLCDTGLLKASVVQWLVKNNFALVMLTEIIS